MSFEDFLKKFYPNTFVEYERSLVPWDSLTPGTIVMTLRNGSGGFKRVTEEFEKNDRWEHKILESLGPDRFGRVSKSVLMRKSDLDDWRDEYWWQDVVIIDHEYVTSLPWKERDKYEKDVIEGRRAN